MMCKGVCTSDTNLHFLETVQYIFQIRGLLHAGCFQCDVELVIFCVITIISRGFQSTDLISCLLDHILENHLSQRIAINLHLVQTGRWNFLCSSQISSYIVCGKSGTNMEMANPLSKISDED